MLHIPNVLSKTTVLSMREQLECASWQDGKITAGTQAALRKNNQQLDEQAHLTHVLQQQVLHALSQHAIFFSAALPKHIYPPLFNCYQGSNNAFGDHVDNAVRTHAASAKHIRTDLSFTLFLSEPDSYDGGELVVSQGNQTLPIKLAAGDLLLYPTYVLHRVEPVTRGARYACVSWIQSMIRDPQQRTIMYDLDRAISSLRVSTGESEEALQLTNVYHNLLRVWVDV